VNNIICTTSGQRGCFAISPVLLTTVSAAPDSGGMINYISLYLFVDNMFYHFWIRAGASFIISAAGMEQRRNLLIGLGIVFVQP
jgi:hypothetical protein